MEQISLCPSKIDLPVRYLLTGYAASSVYRALRSTFHLLSLKRLCSDDYKNVIVVDTCFSVSCSFVTQGASIYLLIKFCEKAFREILRTVNNFLLNQL